MKIPLPTTILKFSAAASVAALITACAPPEHTRHHHPQNYHDSGYYDREDNRHNHRYDRVSNPERYTFVDKYGRTVVMTEGYVIERDGRHVPYYDKDCTPHEIEQGRCS